MHLLFTLMFTLVPLFIVVVFVLVIGSILVGIVRSFMEWQTNNSLPILTVLVSVATKRQHVSGGGNDSSASTCYYATFETLTDSLRQEFAISSTQYSALAEGDTGQLTYQGTRFKSFVRDRTPRPLPPVHGAEPQAAAPLEWTCAYCNSHVAGAEPKCPACGSSSRLERERST
jgi:hypothetical protein